MPFARALEVPPPAGPDEVTVNMLAQPLDFTPGERQAYSNFGYCLLGRIIERVTGRSYEDYVKENILRPAGARSMSLGRSFFDGRAPGEVRYYSPHWGPSVFAENLGRRVPYPYGGWHLEAMDSHGAWIASVVDLARFAAAFDDFEACPFLVRESLERMHRSPGGATGEQASHYVLGWGKATSEAGPVYTHSGSLAGTSTLLVRRPDGRNWVALFNGRSSPTTSRFSGVVRPLVGDLLDRLSRWPEGDLFERFPRHRPDKL